jgi:hypothetical protein
MKTITLALVLIALLSCEYSAPTEVSTQDTLAKDSIIRDSVIVDSVNYKSAGVVAPLQGDSLKK